MRVTSLIVVLLIGSADPAAAQPEPKLSKAAKKCQQSLDVEKAALGKAEPKAKRTFVTDLKAVEAKILQQDPAPVGKVRAKAVADERLQFERDGKLPKSDDALPALFNYMTVVHAARGKVRQAHGKLADQLTKDKDVAGAAKARTDLVAFDANAPGAGTLRNGSKWTGALQKPDGVTTIAFTAANVADGVVTGEVGLDNGWRRMKVQGVQEGPYFTLRVSGMIIGTPQAPVFTGFVLGDRMVIQVANLQVNRGKAKGLPIGGIAALTLVKAGQAQPQAAQAGKGK